MSEATDHHILLLNHDDFVLFHDALMEWAYGWFEAYGSYEHVDTGEAVLVIPIDGLDGKFHTLDLKRPK